MAEVARVEYVVTQRIEVIREGRDVMRSDEPLLVVNAHAILNILEVVVGRQVQLVARRDVVMHELGAILYQSETFVWVILLSSLDINKVLFDVSSSFG